jgi:hypothetical protein
MKTKRIAFVSLLSSTLLLLANFILVLINTSIARWLRKVLPILLLLPLPLYLFALIVFIWFRKTDTNHEDSATLLLVTIGLFFSYLVVLFITILNADIQIG